MYKKPQYYNFCGTSIPTYIAKILSTLNGSNGEVIHFKNVDESVPNVKRNKSSSWTIIFPTRNEKKPKLFAILNRFAALSIEDDSNDDVFPASCDNSSITTVQNYISSQPHVSLATTLLRKI